MNEKLRDEIIQLLADANNFLMTIPFKGDEVHSAAAIMRKCHELVHELSPPPEPESAE